MTFYTLREALDRTLKVGRGYVLLRHEIEEGEVVRPHRHPKAKEFVIFTQGYFEVGCGTKSQIVRCEGVCLVTFPPQTVHHLKNLGSKFAYYVVRDQPDVTVYEKG
jgi:quercetin dioxygenase-like cupin family protein